MSVLRTGSVLTAMAVLGVSFAVACGSSNNTTSGTGGASGSSAGKSGASGSTSTGGKAGSSTGGSSAGTSGASGSAGQGTGGQGAGAGGTGAGGQGTGAGGQGTGAGGQGMGGSAGQGMGGSAGQGMGGSGGSGAFSSKMCQTACNTAHMTGAQAVNGAFINDCICASGDSCAMSCASDLCMMKMPGSACNTCFNMFVSQAVPAACNMMVDAVVANNADGQQWISCLSGCGQNNTPATQWACVPGDCQSYTQAFNGACAAPKCTMAMGSGGSAGSGGSSGSSCTGNTMCVTYDMQGDGYCFPVVMGTSLSAAQTACTSAMANSQPLGLNAM